MIRASGPDRGDDRILRAKYLDWCSARVAEQFLKLTPDQIYELAQHAAQGDRPGPEARVPGAASPDEPDSMASPAFSHPALHEAQTYGQVVEAVTRVLTARLKLPGFEEWRVLYIASPEQYDEELLGLWREGL